MTLQDAMAKFKIQVKISPSLSIFPNVNCNLQILVLGNKHFTGCLRKVYSWTSNKVQEVSCFWKKIYLQGRKSREPREQAAPAAAHRGGSTDPTLSHQSQGWGFEISSNVSGVLNPGQLLTLCSALVCLLSLVHSWKLK